MGVFDPVYKKLLAKAPAEFAAMVSMITPLEQYMQAGRTPAGYQNDFRAIVVGVIAVYHFQLRPELWSRNGRRYVEHAIRHGRKALGPHAAEAEQFGLDLVRQMEEASERLIARENARPRADGSAIARLPVVEIGGGQPILYTQRPVYAEIMAEHASKVVARMWDTPLDHPLAAVWSLALGAGYVGCTLEIARRSASGDYVELAASEFLSVQWNILAAAEERLPHLPWKHAADLTTVTGRFWDLRDLGLNLALLIGESSDIATDQAQPILAASGKIETDQALACCGEATDLFVRFLKEGGVGPPLRPLAI